MVRIMAAFAAALLAAPLMAVAASAWTTDCKDNRCGVSVNVNDDAKKQRLLTFSVLLNKDGSDAGVLVVTPLGTALDAGLRLIAGGKETRLQFKVCYPDGCQAYAAMTADELAAFRAAPDVDVQFFVQGSDKPLSAKIDLAGFDAGVAEAMK
jgi:invasion protein IalB